jgi:hypothetical protein
MLEKTLFNYMTRNGPHKFGDKVKQVILSKGLPILSVSSSDP